MASHGYRETLAQRGLQPFLWTQFLGAFNDNLFKIVVSMLAVRAAADGASGGQLSLLGVIAFLFGHLQLTYVVLFLIALQATFFSPAKYAILPEMLPDRELSRANGVLEMSTFVAIVLGTAVGGYLFQIWRG